MARFALVLLLVLAGAFVPRAARADLTGDPPTAIERLFLQKFVLLTDQDDGGLYPLDGDTELMIRVIVRQGGHEVIWWDLIEDINMDGAQEHEFKVIDLSQAPRAPALVFLHDTCSPFDAPRVEIDAWEVDIDNIGPFLGKLGAVVGISGIFVPHLGATGAALTGVGKIFEILGNDQDHLGSSKHGFPAPYTLPPLSPGETEYTLAPNYSYTLKFEREEIDATTCHEGEGIALALSRLNSQTTLPAERDWWRAFIAGVLFAHPLSQNPGIVADRVWNGIPQLLAFVDALFREKGTDPKWVSRQLKYFADDLKLHRGLGGNMLLGEYLAESYSVVLQERDGGCWPTDIPEGVLLLHLGHLAFDVTTDSDGREHMVMVEHVTGPPDKVRILDVKVVDGVSQAEVIESVDCDGCDPFAVFDGIQIVAGPGGELHALYIVRNAAGEEELRYARKTPPGAWQYETLDDAPGRRYSVPLNLLVDAQGRPHVGYGRADPDLEDHAEVIHAVLQNGTWVRTLVASPKTGTPPRCRMALDADSRPHFAYGAPATGGRVTPRRETPLVEGEQAPRRSIVYRSPDMAPDQCEVVDSDFRGSEDRFALLAIDPTGQPRIAYAEQNGDRSELRHHQRLPYLSWRSERIDSSQTPIAPVGFAVDDDGRSHIVYSREGPEQDFAGTRTRTIHAQQWRSYGGYREDLGLPAPDTASIMPGDVDPVKCSWRREIKDEILGIVRTALDTEIAESIAGGGDLTRRLLSENDRASGDSQLAAHNHLQALAAYRQGIERLVLERHGGEDHSVSVPPPVRISEPRILSVRRAETRGGLRIVFQVAQREPVRIDLFDLQGRRVARLVDEIAEPGVHERVWNPGSTRGSGLAPGLRFSRMVTPSGQDHRQVVLLD